MEAKITNIGTQGFQPTVTVGFFDDKVQVHEKKYFLDPGQTIEDIKPQIKEDLNRIEKTVAESKKLREVQGKAIDLEGVKSVSELKAEEEVKNPVDENTGSSDPSGHASNEPDEESPIS